MEKEIELETVTIDDKNYYVLKKIPHNENIYYYLSNTLDENDTLIRKQDKDNESVVIPLDDDKEFELACNLILKNILL